METIYETDLINRKTENSIVCIYSGTDYDEAYRIADEYNKTLPDYNPDLGFDDYCDRKSDGIYANIWVCEHKEQIHGVGRF